MDRTSTTTRLRATRWAAGTLLAALLAGCGTPTTPQKGAGDVPTADSTAEEQLAEIDRAVQTAREHLGPEFGTWKGEPWTVELYRDTTRPRACDDGFRYLLELTAPGSEPAEVGRTGIAIAEDLDLELNENNHDGSTQDQAFIGAGASQGRTFILEGGREEIHFTYAAPCSTDPSLRQAFEDSARERTD